MVRAGFRFGYRIDGLAVYFIHIYVSLCRRKKEERYKWCLGLIPWILSLAFLVGGIVRTVGYIALD